MQSWHVEAASITKEPLAAEERDQLIRTLPGLAAIADDEKTRCMTITFRVRAPDWDAAVTEASSVLTDAAREVLGDVLPFLGVTVGKDKESLAGAAPFLVGYVEIAAMFGFSRQRAREIAETHDIFPAPLARLATGPVFTLAGVQEFMAKWERRPGRPRKI
ncbi:hypothetical protein [Sinosporangium siamense]|uniref:Uncharacterized protein n=1 Tax=Sinosporangium siamense TaxID=1367973 RepID=A0A919RP89_9ACTN|nr:hypothetical protein [Sinosporangium siamense]GII96762.1 hypothetical protein Ssi02_69930 [Sinosporangium siamense]